MDGDLNSIEQALVAMWSSFSVEPQYAQTTLRHFRELCKKHGPMFHAKKFLEETKDVSGEAVVVMIPGKLSLLVDDNNSLLRFA